MTLKRSTVEAAIVRLQAQRAEAIAEQQKLQTDSEKRVLQLLDGRLSAYRDHVQHSIKMAKAELVKATKLAKQIKKNPTPELIDKWGKLLTTFSGKREDTRTNWHTHSDLCLPRINTFVDAVDTFHWNRDADIRTLQGLLALMSGDEIVLSNSLADKLLAHTNLLGLLQ
jgi:hypothetical protein